MSILHVSASISTPTQSLSSSTNISGCPIPARVLFLTTKFSNLSLATPNNNPLEMNTIRMGGGPRTFPGGVSKWQWKRMQAKKSKQLLKARLARERQIYEMRKRAELKAAVSELERPWEAIEKAPTLFSASADEQLKVLADRFQMPGGFDLWSERDGPELFRPDNGVPSARFFPKGVVHGAKAYGRSEETSDVVGVFESLSLGEDSEIRGSDEKTSVGRKSYNGNSKRMLQSGFDKGTNAADIGSRNLGRSGKEGQSGNVQKGRFE